MEIGRSARCASAAPSDHAGAALSLFSAASSACDAATAGAAAGAAAGARCKTNSPNREQPDVVDLVITAFKHSQHNFYQGKYT